ncbi:PLP-dependent transferase [Vararia minispora EC-137]|uniref:PLP-dependent transferase n=1 Tax=Vararia minispora EC-137 TaxID=1314806 RepID=A0ACB8QP68_9AGAM|nr:PLP-dependent transferase [Vararia minispora EC-137]
MSNISRLTFKQVRGSPQPQRLQAFSPPLSRIPGPIEVSDEVLFANAHPSMSHMSADFTKIFGDSIRMTRDVLLTKTGQPFLISGSGTLGWDQVSANLVQQGESVLVLNTGYFGDSFADCLATYGAQVDQIYADFGTTVDLAEVEKALSSKRYKAVTITHVDTSTAVLTHPKPIADLVQKHSPDTLVILDSVCAVASEDIHMEEWGIDVVLSASQKGIGAPPGLSILVASQKAIAAFNARTTPIPTYYASWKRWLPIMQAYEKGTAAYFATPPVNLIYAFHAALSQILNAPGSLEARLQRHKETSARIKAAAEEIGLKQVPADPVNAANGMTALYCPEGVKSSELAPALAAKGVIIAGGLGTRKDTYFRIGHMGITAVDNARDDVDRIVNALKEVVAEKTAAIGKV